ncbi:DUF2971 domain-containing protein [Nitrospira sp. MA-1]|nr:DUF2971 domain-containing protein [Nitrospira sp. MA-1]
MSLAKYVDLLRSKSIFCPKASLFQDETEGKWVAHAVVWGEKQRWTKAKHNAERLQKLLTECAGDQDRILIEADNIYRTLDGIEQKSAFGDVLKGLVTYHPSKREEYLQMVVSSWLKHHDNYNESVQEWVQQVSVARESTYISCWTRAKTMSLAMWNQYGGGTESVAVCSSVEKLKALVANNLDWLQRGGLSGEVIDVEYVEGLKEPGNALQGDLVERLNLGKDVRVGAFSIKPCMYAYENEIRAIIYPVRDLFGPVVDPHPESSGVSLSIDKGNHSKPEALSAFIESVYVHPMLDAESMMVRVVKAINERFGIADLPTVTDKVEALGPDMVLRPTGYAGSGD